MATCLQRKLPTLLDTLKIAHHTPCLRSLPSQVFRLQTQALAPHKLPSAAVEFSKTSVVIIGNLGT